MQVDRLPRSAKFLEVTAAQMLCAEGQCSARHRVVHRFRPGFDLTSDRGTDEVSAVGVKALTDEKIDLAEVDRAHVDGDLLALVDLRHRHSIPSAYHPRTILTPS